MSRLFQTSSNDTATVSLDAIRDAQGIAGTQAYMHPNVLELIGQLTNGKAANQELDAGLLVQNDTFGLGCVIAYLCSKGLHPYQNVMFDNIPANIRAHRRMALGNLDVADPRHVELVDRFTTWKDGDEWTVTQALTRSAIFEQHGQSSSAILMDQISLFQKPQGASESCEQELLTPEVVTLCPGLPGIMGKMRKAAKRLLGDKKVNLDMNSYVVYLVYVVCVGSVVWHGLIFFFHLCRCMAILAYTMDNGQGKEQNLYYVLNNALRGRKVEPKPFRAWQGFLYYLMRAMDQLPKFEGTVYRGGNKGIDQDTVHRDYAVGRPVQWAAFSSTSLSLGAVRTFVQKEQGVVFKIQVLTGRDIGPYSYFPKESEILLSPNTHFVVTSKPYQDEQGYTFVDLAETKGSLLQS